MQARIQALRGSRSKDGLRAIGFLPLSLDGAIAMANAYPHTPLLPYHWGSVDAPDFPPFNADPDSLPDRVENPERIKVLAPGEPFVLRRLQS